MKIEFHYTFLLMAFSFVITGNFQNIIIVTSLILVHEMGHTLAAWLCGIKVDKIIIYPYGGLTKLDSLVNENINKELLVAVSGLFFQTLFSLVMTKFIGDYKTVELFELYNKSMFIYNILPIYPLDGSKILTLILSKYFSFRKVNILTVIISLVVLVLFIRVTKFNYSMVMVVSILLFDIYKFYLNLEYLYNRFLLERYLYRFNYQKLRIVEDKNNMYKDCRHLIKNDKKYQKEEEMLGKMFDLHTKI